MYGRTLFIRMGCNSFKSNYFYIDFVMLSNILLRGKISSLWNFAIAFLRAYQSHYGRGTFLDVRHFVNTQRMSYVF